MTRDETQVLLLNLAIEANVPVLLIGAPGTAKTSIITAMAHQLGRLIECIIASIHDSTDFSGFPAIDTHQDKDGSPYRVMSMLPPAWAHRLSERTIGDRRGMLFIDEISTAPPTVQAALLRPICEGVVGDVKLGPNVARLAAANPTEQSAGGWNLAAPLSNRFCWIFAIQNYRTGYQTICSGFYE